MSMKKRRATRQEELFVPTSALPDAPGHPFYSKLNELLATHCFDAFVEERCASYYAKTLGRPSIGPGVYFRMLMIGYFEGLGSEHGIDWRVADSLALRSIVRRDTGEGYDDYLEGLAKAKGSKLQRGRSWPSSTRSDPTTTGSPRTIRTPALPR